MNDCESYWDYGPFVAAMLTVAAFVGYLFGRRLR